MIIFYFDIQNFQNSYLVLSCWQLYLLIRQLNLHLAHVLVILSLSEVLKVDIGLGTAPIYIRPGSFHIFL